MYPVFCNKNTYFNVICFAKVIRYPHPTSNFFSSDFGNSHDPAGLGLGARAPHAPRGYATAYGLIGLYKNATMLLTCRWFL